MSENKHISAKDWKQALHQAAMRALQKRDAERKRIEVADLCERHVQLVNFGDLERQVRSDAEKAGVS